MDVFYVKAMAYFGAALGMGLGMIGPALGLGMVGQKACDAIAKSPDAAGKIRMTMIIAMGMIEACAVYVLVVSVLIIIKA